MKARAQVDDAVAADAAAAQVGDAAATAAVATAGAGLEGEAEGAELEPRVEQEIEVGADEDEAEAAESESPAEPETEALVSTEVTTPTDAERTADGKRRMQSAIERAIRRGELEACGHSMLSIMWKCLTCCEVGNRACWMDTDYGAYLCEKCWKTQSTAAPMVEDGRIVKELLTECLGNGCCTNKIPHPSPGEEFCLGCAECRMQEAAQQEAAEAEAKEMGEATTEEAQMEAAMALSLDSSDFDVERKRLMELETDVALSLEFTVPDGRRIGQVTPMAQVKAAEGAIALSPEFMVPNEQKAEQLLSPAGVLEQERLLQQAAQVMRDRRAIEHELQHQQIDTEDRGQPAAEQGQLARALAESLADKEQRELSQEAERVAMQKMIDASEEDAKQAAERAEAEEDKIAETLAESKRVADKLEEGEAEDAIRLVESGDADTVALSRAQVAGMPTHDTETFERNIRRSGLWETETPSDGNCFYHAWNMSIEGTPQEALTPNGMRDYSADMALMRGDIDEAEAELRKLRGRMVEYKEIQAAATAMKCRVVIYNARPGEGEPDMDTVVPEGNGAILRDICMVLRSAHYTALLNERQWQKVEQDRSSDALRKSTRSNIRCHRPVTTVPEIGVPRGNNVTQSSRESRTMTGNLVWTQIVSPRGMARVNDPSTGVKLEARELGAQEAKDLCNTKFVVRAVPARAADLGYAEDSDYDTLTRKQRKSATRFTHKFDVVGVATQVGITTQPKGTGKSQEAEQVGSSGEAVPVYPFNQAALQARSTERSRKAKAENDLAMQKQRGYGPSANNTVHSLSSCTTTDQYTSGLQEAEDVQQALLRRAAVWAMKIKGQDPKKDFNGSPAQRMIQEQIESIVAETDGTEDQGIEGRDLVWWFHSWQHWQQDKDRKLSSCTDFDAMHFARTQKVCLGGAWGCVLAQMQETECDEQAVEMLRSTFRLASATRGRRTPGSFSGTDAQQMSDSASHSSSSAGSGTGGGAGGETESAAGEQPASGEETTGQHGSERQHKYGPKSAEPSGVDACAESGSAHNAETDNSRAEQPE